MCDYEADATLLVRGYGSRLLGSYQEQSYCGSHYSLMDVTTTFCVGMSSTYEGSSAITGT